MDTNPVAEVAEEVSEDAIADRLTEMFGGDEPEEQPEASEAEEPDSETDEEEGEVETDQAPESEEVELEGAKFAVPKPVAEVVKKAASLQADYTRKTQEVAETRKVVEDKAQFVEAKEQLLSVAFAEAAELHSIQQQLKAYEGVNWAELIAQDAQQALRLQVARQELASKLTERQQALNSKIQQVQQATELHKRRQYELGQQELTRRLGTIKDQDRQSMLEAAKELGFDEGDMLNPRALHALHLAAKYMALQKSKPQVQKRVAEAKPMKPPVARSAPQTQRLGALADLADKAKRTGRDEYAAAYFERKFGRG